jgi:hypothetical protein
LCKNQDFQVGKEVPNPPCVFRDSAEESLFVFFAFFSFPLSFLN